MRNKLFDYRAQILKKNVANQKLQSQCSFCLTFVITIHKGKKDKKW